MWRPHTCRRTVFVVLIVGVVAAGCSSQGAERSDRPVPTDLPVLAAGDPLPRGASYRFEVGTHCGVGSLGLPINGDFWIADESGGKRDWIPAEWADTLDPGDAFVTMRVMLSSDGEVLTATVGDRSVTYRRVTDADQLYLCA